MKYARLTKEQFEELNESETKLEYFENRIKEKGLI